MTNPQDASPTPEQIRRWRRYLAEERHEADTYRALARTRDGEEREILNRLVEAEGRHEAYWLNLLGEHALPAPKVPWRSRLLSAFALTFGSIFVLAMMQRTEQRSAYDIDQDVPAQMAADEHVHGEVVRALAAKGRSQLSGMFRAGVFGINDGLVSNLALILGIAAAGAAQNMVILAGVSGLLAGALSMAAGEYISVKSQRELLEASAPDPAASTHLPELDVDANELALIFRARGIPEQEAQAKADALLASFESAQLEPVPHEVSPDFEEVGSARTAAMTSFVFFALGALLPLLPFLFGLTGLTGVVVALTVVGMALLFTGGVVGILSGQPPFWRGIRQLLIGFGAAGATYALGWLFGTSGI
ncbi:rubrerythrin family protein [Boudabousia liubingyangii]|uniref:Rubrerythrin family protein n=1 Tax=Boudabousia liubingyangii TaxID=1921764 RepID=A0A1Q5PPM3_9ACTO|nr:VIT1/CCC1 family protein [Boudabousia liubingyangii]OKL48496.1 rubrerythrin family protein [Boudabousia liubingyangii]OKL49466.1 rubrerythrin family protein [Boudabousia liubingyangii]